MAPHCLTTTTTTIFFPTHLFLSHKFSSAATQLAPQTYMCCHNSTLTLAACTRLHSLALWAPTTIAPLHACEIFTNLITFLSNTTVLFSYAPCSSIKILLFCFTTFWPISINSVCRSIKLFHIKLTNDRWFQIDKNSPWNIFSTSCLWEEGAEWIIWLSTGIIIWN